MRKLFTILFLMASLATFAQQPTGDFTTVMVNGQVTSAKLEDMDAKNILLVEKLTSPMEVGSSRNNINIKVITKPFAVKEYQKKLIGFSKEYKAYLDGSKGDDTELMYVVNGSLTDHRDSVTMKLYQLPLKKIKTVAYFSKDEGGDKYLPIMKSLVIITTKK